MFVLMKSGMSSKMVHVGSKTRSQVQILEKPCVCSRGHIFSLIIMKLGQNVFIGKILVVFENGHFGSKCCVCSRDQIFGLILMKLVQSFCLDETLYIFENGSYWVKN